MQGAYTTDVDVRFRDLDTMGHVNNAIYATYLEEARVDYYRDVIGVSLPDVDTVIVDLSVDFRAPIDVHDDVEVALAASGLGESSIPMEYEVRVDGDLAAEAETVQVTWDREAGTSRPIPDDWRESIEAFHG